MILIFIALLSVIIAMVRKGSFANILDADLKASYLFAISLIFFIAVRLGNAAGVGIIVDFTYWIMLAAYSFLLLGIILNLNNLWMFILLLGAVLNFVVIFINGGKMPISLDSLQMAGLTADYLTGSATQMLASSATNLSFLGGIIPIPLPGIFAEVVSPGTLIIGIGMFGVIQNILLGIVYVYEDEEEDMDEQPEKVIEAKKEKEDKKQLKKEEKRSKKNKKEEDEYFFDDEDEDEGANGDEDFTFGKDYTMGNININNVDDDDGDVDESLFTTQIPPTETAEKEEETSSILIDDILGRNLAESEDDEPLADSASFFAGIQTEEEPVEFDILGEVQETVPEAEEPAAVEPEPDIRHEEKSEPEYQQPEITDAAYEDEYQDTMVIPTDEIKNRRLEPELTPDELTYSTEALKEVKEVIENDIPQKKEILDYNKEIAQDPPLQADTDSPFIIVNGRIVENPYYKFKRGVKDGLPEGNTQIDSSVYVMKSRNPNTSGRPSFSPPNRNITPPLKKAPSAEEPKQESTGYEKVEMKIGDVQIKFWKKDKDE